MQDKAKFLKQNIPYLAFFYVGNIFSHHVRAYTGGDIIDKIFQGILELNTMSFIPSVHPIDVLMGVGVAALNLSSIPKAKMQKNLDKVESMDQHDGLHNIN